jgi:hypothetical protein
MYTTITIEEYIVHYSNYHGIRRWYGPVTSRFRNPSRAAGLLDRRDLLTRAAGLPDRREPADPHDRAVPPTTVAE